MRKIRRRGGPAGSGGFGRGRGRGRGRGGHHSYDDPNLQLRPHSPCRLNLSVTRETLTYAQAQKMVEVELDGRLHRINISDPLSVITEDEMTAQDLAECNSNKENSEQTPAHTHTHTHAASRARPGRKGRRREGKQTAAASSAHTSTSSRGMKKGSDGSTNRTPPHAPLPRPTFCTLEAFLPEEAEPLPVAYYRYMERSGEDSDTRAEYDMDEEDMAWLEMVNQKRVSDGVASVSPDTFELLIDRLEHESVVESRSQALAQSAVDDEDAYCTVCLDDECLNSNVILFCDMCNLAVHQECYGVPYVPEGQWLCRRCLQSPSRPVDCVLCPNRGGAFKQTSDGRWAHVICAIWIPEVCFANTVFLEPVEGTDNIPAARWKLTCYLCKQKGRGASIQCHKANCYRAFHVTCAQGAGLYMKIDPVRENASNGTTFSVKKTAFCETHSPPPGEDDGEDEGKMGGLGGSRGHRGQRAYTLAPAAPQTQRGGKKGQKQKGRRSSEGRRAAVPVLLVPQIPSYRLNKICTGVAVQRKNQFMQRLHNYWLLKRHSRNGVPLIRRLHTHLQNQRAADQREPDEKLQAVREELKYWQKLRQDLEKARLLVELIRKRERLKREQMKVQQAALELQLTPGLVLLRSTLDQLQEKDSAGIFTTPVSLKEVPDYLEFVSEPMDFSTMRAKLEAHAYAGVADLEADFGLMVSNCLRYNDDDTVFHRTALQLGEVGGAILRHAQRQAVAMGIDPHTGMHLPEPPPQNTHTHTCWEEVDSLLVPENRLHLSSEQQLRALLDKLDAVMSMRTSGGRTKRIRLLRREVNSLRHKLSHRRRLPTPLCTSPLKEEDEEQDQEQEQEEAEAGREAKSKEEYATIPSQTPENHKPKTPPPTTPSCPASSPLPGDAPPLAPSLGPESTGTHTPGTHTGTRTAGRPEGTDTAGTPTGTHTQGTRLAARSRGRGRRRVEGQGVGSDKAETPQAEVGETPNLPEGGENGLPYSTVPSVATVMGVGRRTSVLFKKAKNGARQRKAEPVGLVNGGGVEKGHMEHAPDRPERFHSEPEPVSKAEPPTEPVSKAEPPTEPVSKGDPPTEPVSKAEPPTEPVSKAEPPTEPVPSSPRHLRSRGPSSDSESQNTHTPVPAPALAPQTHMPTLDTHTHTHTPFKDSALTNGCKKHRDDSPDSLESGTHTHETHSSPPPKRSRGKPALSKAPAADLENGDIGTGEGLLESHEGEEEDLAPLHLVWAKCRGYPSYPAMMVDPCMPREGLLHNGVPIPVPPKEVLKLGEQRQAECEDKLFLVLFFDTKRTWQWLPRDKLHRLGLDDAVDKLRLVEGKKPNVRKSVHTAYSRAIAHLSHVRGNANFSPSSYI
ncbi:bromodomain and PHD finger-containing protein 3 isoform X2 [Alosa sapidissima]|uniref:bromodomain and PHD finger-containing protein 3 isoform X2 n=1 Tax=Alosa sapidissima TaxID=34773 RepID=UPI001C0A190A|nr:bromodomain and PHD finger-containing protein 3 isoform X2 [Alosa sapidissima]